MSEMMEEWRETRKSWRDDVANIFQRESLDPLAPRVNAALEAMEELDKLLRKVREDCE